MFELIFVVGVNIAIALFLAKYWEPFAPPGSPPPDRECVATQVMTSLSGLLLDDKVGQAEIDSRMRFIVRKCTPPPPPAR